MDTVRVGIIGVGKMGRTHIDALRDVALGEAVAVTDPANFPDVGPNLAKEYGLDYEERIAETQAEIESLQAMERDYETRNSERVYWKPVLQTIRELAPTDVTLLTFEQNDNEITVEGELGGEVQDAIIIVEYAQLLDERRDIFSRVAFEIGTDERKTGEDSKTEEIFIFTMLLEVKPGG